MEDNVLERYLVAQEEYYKLSAEDQRLYSYMKQIDYIKGLMNLNANEDASEVIINFATKKDLGRTNISFDIANLLFGVNDPYILYSIRGSLLETGQITNFIFDSFLVYGKQSDNQEHKYVQTSIYQDTKVSESISLIESFNCDRQYKNILPNSAKLVISSKKSRGEEKNVIEIPENDRYYHQYRHHIIDTVTFSNWILLNSNQMLLSSKKRTQNEINRTILSKKRKEEYY